jgi:hypothetical protein
MFFGFKAGDSNIYRWTSAFVLAGTIAQAPAFCEQGYSITQTAKSGAALGGGMTLYISPQGMRTYEAKSGVSVLTHAPSWIVYIFNDKTKRVYSTNLQPWLDSFKRRNIGGRFEGASWKRGNPNGAVAGVRAYEFVMDKPPMLKTTSRALNGKAKNYQQIQSASLWVASDIATPPEVSKLICQFYGVPDCQRIPLRMTVNEAGKPPQVAVDTSRVAKMNIPDNMFAVPRGYQPVKQDSDVFIDKESMDTLDEMLNDLDSPSPKRGGAPQRPGYPQRR